MQNPADMKHGQFNNFTSGVANTQVTTNLVAAPGVGSRLRIWAFGGGAALSNAAAHTLAMLFQQQAGVYRWVLRTDQNGNASYHIPGGFALDDNTAFQVVQSASVATLSVGLWVDYTVEATT